MVVGGRGDISLARARNPPASGIIPAFFLPEGATFLLGGEPLHVYRSSLTLAAHGSGATLDAQGISRHFEVADGGSVTLRRVRLAHGGLVRSGGCARSS